MENLSLLNVKCLANMPMLLDSLSFSIEKIKSVLTPYYSEFETLIKKETPSLEYYIDQWENGTIYALGFGDDYKENYIEEITPIIELRFQLIFEQTKKRNPLRFEIIFGYICDEKQNVIYFQLSENSEKIGLINEDLINELNQAIPNDWEKGTDDNSIYVQFTIDENLSNDKINNCATTFKEYILSPFFHKLKN